MGRHGIRDGAECRRGGLAVTAVADDDDLGFTRHLDEGGGDAAVSLDGFDLGDTEFARAGGGSGKQLIGALDELVWQLGEIPDETLRGDDVRVALVGRLAGRPIQGVRRVRARVGNENHW